MPNYIFRKMRDDAAPINFDELQKFIPDLQKIDETSKMYLVSTSMGKKALEKILPDGYEVFPKKVVSRNPKPWKEHLKKDIEGTKEEDELERQ